MSYLVHLEAVIPPLPPGVTHISTDWEVATDIAFTNVIASSYNDTTNLSTWYTIVNATPPLYGRSRITTSIGTIDWSEPQLCLTNIERPVISISGEPDTIPIDPVFTGSTFISSIPGDTHLSTDWIVTDPNGIIVWSSIGDTANLLSIHMPTGILTSGSTYKVTVRYNGSSGESSPYAVKEFTVATVTVQTPNVSIQGYPVSITSHPQIYGSPFTSSDPTDTHAASSWIIEDTNGNIVFQSLNDTTNLTSITLPYGTLEPNTTYIAKLQYISAYTSSNYGTQTFTTMNVVIDSPAVTITGEPSNISTGPQITGTAFTVLTGTDTHYATDWVIKDSTNTIVWQSIFDTTNLTSITVPLGTLSSNSNYTLEVRYHGNISTSPWTLKTFTTANVIIAAPNVIVQGEPNNVPPNPQITGDPFTVLTGADTHISTDWIIEDTLGNVVWQSLADTTNLTSIIANANLALSTNYVVKVRYNGIVSSSNFTVKNIITTSITISTPTLTVQGAPNSVPTGPQLTATPFTVTIGTDTHASTDWIIEDTLGTVVWQSLNDTVALTSITVPSGTLNNSTTYVFKVIYRGASGAVSSPGIVTATTVSSTPGSGSGSTFSTTLPVIQDPTLTVQGEPNSVPTGPQLTGSAFALVSGSDTHLFTDWIIKDQATSNTVWSSIGDTTNLTTITVPTGTLSYNTSYIVYVKYYGNVSSSNWVSKTVTTAAAPPSVNTWSPANVFPYTTYTHSQSTLQDGRVLVITGKTTNISVPIASIYNPVNDIWTNVTARPNGTLIGDHSQSTLADGRVLVVGGSIATGPVNSVDIYDPTTDTWSPAANYPIIVRYHSQSTLSDGRVLVVGGRDGTNTLNTCYIYDPATNTWSPAANYPIGIYHHSQSTLSDGRVLVVGGLDNTNTAVNTCHIYDPATNTWTPAANYTIAIYEHSQSTLSDGRVLVVAGLDNTNIAVNTCHIYDPATNTWTPAANYSVPVRSHSQSTLTDGRVLVVGGFSGGAGINNCNIYTP